MNIATATYEELEAAGLCDCGDPLAGHPPLPKVDTRSWHSVRNTEQPWRNTVTGKTLTPAQLVFSNTDPARRWSPEKIRVCGRVGCGEAIPPTRGPNAKYCGAGCQRQAGAQAYRDRNRRSRIRVA